MPEAESLPAPLSQRLWEIGYEFWAYLPQAVAAIAFIIVVWIAVKAARWLLGRALRRARLRRSLIDVFKMLAGAMIWIVGALITMMILFPSVTPGNALAALGLGSVAIGFAFKDSFENFLAGIMILVREPFRLGDHIESTDVEGQIEVINIRDTHLRRTDGQLVVVPNSLLFREPVRVLTDRELRRTTIICGVSYGADIDQAREVIRNAVKQVDSVRDDVRDVQIFAQAFSASSIDFEVTWWTGSRPVDIRASRDQVVAAVKRALNEAGIEIPLPHRVLLFREDAPLRLARGEEAEPEPSPAAASERAASRRR